jgi:hypothetical protein
VVVNALLAATQDFLAYKFYEFDPNANKLYDVSLGAPDFSAINGNIMQTPLPDGSMLVADAGFHEFYIYRPTGALPAQYARPSITTVSAPVNGLYTLSGTTLNGLTNGANRDDEGHPFTSFPIVVLKRGTSTWYGDVRSTSAMSIASGAASTIQFALPPGIPSGQLTVTTSASGVSSTNSKTITM